MGRHGGAHLGRRGGAAESAAGELIGVEGVLAEGGIQGVAGQVTSCVRAIIGSPLAPTAHLGLLLRPFSSGNKLGDEQCLAKLSLHVLAYTNL